jgi:hypothetical protein
MLTPCSNSKHVFATLPFPRHCAPPCRAVADEERQSAPSAVAHEATLLALMTSNACLVHKLDRLMQLAKLHCEMQQAAVTLGGRHGGCPGAAGPEAVPACGAGGTSRVLQLWDYEGSLEPQVGACWWLGGGSLHVCQQ